MSETERLKKTRTILRTAVTKITNNIDNILKSDPIDLLLLEEYLDQLSIKSTDLKNVDNKIEPLIDLSEYDAEITTAHEYSDKITLAIFRGKRKINENRNSVPNLINRAESKFPPTNENKLVKLPKLNIQKFNGEITQFTNFWNIFKVSIHDNDSLTKIEKFNYLRSYLCSSALNAIEGLEISELNYEAAINILEQRFGNKDIIVNHHMNKLLNLTPVYKSNEISRLKKLHDDIEINVRSLNTLGVEPQSYSSMLIAVVLKLLPNDLNLEYNRQNIRSSQTSDINKLLDFLQTEIQSRERSFYFSKERTFENNNNNYKQKFAKSKSAFSSTHELMTAVPDKQTPEQPKCIFCRNKNKNNHISEICTALTVEEKKNILKSRGLCFRCFLRNHRYFQCPSDIICSCGAKHNQALCTRRNSLSNQTSHKSFSSNTLDKKIEVKSDNKEIISAVSCIEKNKIYLQTCTAIAKNEINKKQLIIRLLNDTGSMKTFLAREIRDKLKLKTIRKENLSVFTFGTKEPIQKTYDVVSLRLENKNFPFSSLNIEALVTDEISGSNIPPPEVDTITEINKLQNLTLADTPHSQIPISLLIGADYYYDIVTGNIQHLNKNLVAVETIFGYCIQGRKSENQTSLALNVIIEERLISEQIKKFWDLETSGIINTKLDTDFNENQILKKFESNIKYDTNSKRYEVSLPWKSEKQNLNDNEAVARNRFTRLNRRFIRNPDLYFQYLKVLEDYLEQGIIELVKNPEVKKNITFYLPYREIIRDDRMTSKLRLVFDASSHEPNYPSLNDSLFVGPNLYPEIFDILLLFRLNPVAFTTDMKQAFLQIKIEEKDRDVSRFLFTDDPFDESRPPVIYRFTRVLFGISSSPFLLAATIKFHLKKYREKYPETVDFLNKNVYVDDVIGSHSSVEKALSVSLESIKILEEASLNLHKWHTNSQLLRELWKERGITADDNPETFGDENLPYKVLGIAWNSVEDLLYFDVKGLINYVAKRTDTKRFILQVLGRIFDPIGFLGPFTLRVKILMQKVWCLGINWDDKLPEDISLLWKDWCDEIPQLSNFSVPRYYFSDVSDQCIKEYQLHLFSDASLKAYGTIAYLRVTTSNKNIRTVFVASKNRVSPLKTLTLPRLELMGALLSAKLSKNVLKALNLDIPCFFWTDSKITYFWIKGSPEKFKPFVKHRVEEICKLTSPSEWHHCPGTDNVADLVSRGSKVTKLIDDPTWLSGPKWLKLPPEFWPKSEKEILVDDKEQLEYRKKPPDILQCECVVEEIKNPIDITKFSNFEKLVRVTAWVRRYVMKLKKSSEASNTLTSEELLDSENWLILNEQKRYYKEEFKSLKNGNSVQSKSPLFNFAPFLDETEIIRLGGRLEFGDLSLEEKHPVILPKHSWLTTLIVRRDHEKMMHAGTAHTLTKIRSRYWIPKGRQLVKSIIKKCIVCQKYLSKSEDQVTAPLPRDRINEAPPYSICGLDFAGPLYIKNSKETKKSYIVLFTCGVTRALHLELVPDMTTDSFLLAFRRFLARRGNCKIIYSDNAKTFKKAKKEIENLYEIMSNSSVLKFLTKERIIWKNIVERAAWWGGFYERLVKSVKECLRKVIGKAFLTYEEMSTLLVEVEAILNLRPLTYVYNENDEPQPLTPMHFLNYGKELSMPINFFDVVEEGSKRCSLLKRKKYQTLLLRQLWSKWKNQYLLDLKTTHSLKNPTPHAPLKEGDVVLIEGDTKNKLLWKLGRIQKALPGRDDNIRSYEVKTVNGVLKRTVQHLYPLEL